MKRIVICADGTWNRPEKDLDDRPTNVLRLARGVKPVGPGQTAQQVFYDWGLGSYHSEAVAGATGRGIHKNILDGYRYIVQNYAPGDRLFLFGFSRGAYTVRARVRTAKGAVFVRDAVIRLTGDTKKPFWIHAWRQGRWQESSKSETLPTDSR